MKIQSKFFGEVEIKASQIISFENGIPGFEEYNKFVLLNFEDTENLKCLQSLDDSNICLVMISPWNYFKDYEIELSADDLKELEIQNEQDVAVYNVITTREERITTNLVAPIVINVLNNIGKQIILSNTKYSIRQEITCL